jgi:hypothetical protein
VADPEIQTLNLHRVQTRVSRDRGGRPTIIISDGEITVGLGGGEDRDVLAGVRRVVDGIWHFQMLIAARREAASRR